MQIGQSLAGLGPAFLQALQGSTGAPQTSQSATTSVPGAKRAGDVTPNLEGAKEALDAGRPTRRGSFLDIRA
ncbi:MAG: hypothetical protein AAF530_07495 [Pseudomonadota bacterium]